MVALILMASLGSSIAADTPLHPINQGQPLKRSVLVNFASKLCEGDDVPATLVRQIGKVYTGDAIAFLLTNRLAMREALSGGWTEEQLLVLLADVDGSGEVGSEDMIWVMSFYGQLVDQDNPASWRSDVNFDRKIDRADLLAVAAEYGKKAPVGWRDVDANGNNRVEYRDAEMFSAWFNVHLTGNPKAWSCTINFLDYPGEDEVNIFDLVVFATFWGLPLGELPSLSHRLLERELKGLPLPLPPRKIFP